MTRGWGTVCDPLSHDLYITIYLVSLIGQDHRDCKITPLYLLPVSFINFIYRPCATVHGPSFYLFLLRLKTPPSILKFILL